MLEVLFLLLQIFKFLAEGMEGRRLCRNFLKIYYETCRLSGFVDFLISSKSKNCSVILLWVGYY